MMKPPVAQGIPQPITIFYSYADEDKQWLAELHTRLQPLLRREKGRIIEWHRGIIRPGATSENELRAYLDRAQIILLLISPDFMATHYDSPEVKHILELKFTKMRTPEILADVEDANRRSIPSERSSYLPYLPPRTQISEAATYPGGTYPGGTPKIKVNETPHVIPIFVRNTPHWELSLFSRLKSSPRGRPIQEQQDRDSAFAQVIYEVDEIIQSFNRPPSDDTRPDEPEKATRIHKSELPPKNPYFTGRKVLLDQLRNKFTRPKTTALTHRQAICGLGGIGKTQLAVEFVNSFRQNYKHVFWIVADTRDNLIQGYVEIAHVVGLQEQKQDVVKAVMHWLETSTDWLLVLDNADLLEMVQEFIPSITNGHLLLTTRAQALGEIAELVEIDKMSDEDGALFLLRRAKKIPTEGAMEDADHVDWEVALKIAKALGGLPLALDQAGAYIEETDGRLEHYLRLYQGLGVKLLQKRSELSRSHPASVVTTFLLAFEKVKQASPAAANVLRLCAFLAPDAIPESLLTDPVLIAETNPSVSQPQEQKPHKFLNPLGFLSPAKSQAPSPTEILYMLDDAKKELLKFSLIRSDDRTSTLAVHRLVQDVLRDDMDENTQHQWAERVVRVVNAAFPGAAFHKMEVKAWPACEKLLPQVFVSASLTATYQFTFPEASRLLNDAATYLTEQARYQEAETLYQQALKIRQAQGGPLYAQSLHNLARVYERQGSYSRAEQNLIEALQIQVPVLGEKHPHVAISLNSLAEIYMRQGKYNEAERLYKRALNINRHNFKPEHPSISQNFNNLATLFLEQEKYGEAEEAYKTALEISENKLGKDHPHTAQILHDWGEFYKHLEKLDQAEPLHKRALEIREQKLGEKHADTATSLHSIAELYELQGKSEEAEKLYKQALSIREEVLGRENPDTATTMYNLAKLYRSQGNAKDAEPLYKQALIIREKKLGLNHPSTTENLRELADLYKSQQRFVEAERLYKQGLVIRYRRLSPDDSAITQNLQDLIELYQLLNKNEEIERLYEDAFEQRSSRLGIDHPSTEQSLLDLLKLYESQGKSEEIARLYQRTFEMRAQKLRGNDHNSLAKFEQNLKDLANTYDKLNRNSEKEALYIESYKICSRKLGVADRLAQYCHDQWMKMIVHPGNTKRAGQVPKGKGELELNALPKYDEWPDYPPVLDIDEQTDQLELEREEQFYEQELIKSYQKLGFNHPGTIQRRHNLAKLYESHGKATEAERVYRRALEIYKRNLEPDSPHIIECTNDLASCYLRHRRADKATPLVEQMRQICEPMVKEQPFPKDYTLAIIHSLANAASLYQKKYKDKKMRGIAESWFKQALKICEEELGKAHQDTVDIRNRYVALLKETGREDEAFAVEIDARSMGEADNNHRGN